jgi:hypothetical protein
MTCPAAIIRRYETREQLQEYLARKASRAPLRLAERPMDRTRQPRRWRLLGRGLAARRVGLLTREGVVIEQGIPDAHVEEAARHQIDYPKKWQQCLSILSVFMATVEPHLRLRSKGEPSSCSGAYEMNNEENGTTRIFQIWIHPTTHGGTPSWGARPFPKADRSGRFVTLASGFAEDDALPIRADARVMGATVKAGERVMLALDPKRHAYLVPATGAVDVGGVRIEARDGTAITDLANIEIVRIEDADVVLVDAA